MTGETAGGIIRTEDVGRVRLVTLNRPERLNAFNEALNEALYRALEAANTDDRVHAVVLTGAGRAFSAGADLSDMGRGEPKTDGSPAVGEEHPFLRLEAIAESYPKPLIGAVNGLAVGMGFTLLGYCDFIFVAQSARLRTPFSQLGLSPEASSSYLFPLRMGWSAAARVLMLGDWFTGEDLVKVGFAQEVVPDAELLETVLAFATRVAELPLQSLTATKALMLEPHLKAIVHARTRELEVLGRLAGTPANLEAIAAFKSRREGSAR
jgi:enoyl-CoA hydratase/carnithine racemase